MKVDLSPEHETWLKEAVASGQFASAEEALQTGIELLRTAPLDPPGWTEDEVREELDRRRAGPPAKSWEGAEAFLARMHEKYPKEAHGSGR